MQAVKDKFSGGPTASKPIILYSHATGPNPWKVAIVLEELNLPYEMKMVEMPEMKRPDFEKINPNGRVPAIEDPNTGIVLWESGAIVEYLCETYDKAQALSYGDKSPEKHLIRQWLYFQVSGQGPYFGQKAWFTFFHQEKGLTSAIERYANEIKRVVGVLDNHLAKTGTGWLVGNKCTYADLSFVPWDMMLPFLMGDEGTKVMESAPHFKKWHDAMMARPAVAKIAQDKQAASSKK